MNVRKFDYQLSQELIAPYPVAQRDSSRLMVLDRTTRSIVSRKFFEIVDYLKKEDVLVFNDTRVIPARLYGRKESGGKIEVLLLKQVSKEDTVWECLLHASKKMRLGSKILFSKSVEGEILQSFEGGRWVIKFSGGPPRFSEVLEEIGEPPLPPYIIKRRGDSREEELDKERYQTVYARRKGAIAAPTAGLHFTEQVLSEIKKIGAKLIWITLHVGGGTFLPVRVEEVSCHRMESEYYEISEEDARTINEVKEKGGRVVSVGTTTTRALESSTDRDGVLHSGKGFTNLFIYPGYKFKMIDCLITNFHQPKSTPLMLVCAFAGLNFIKGAYKTAIDKGYRFLSYGDGMLIL